MNNKKLWPVNEASGSILIECLCHNKGVKVEGGICSKVGHLRELAVNIYADK